MAASLHLQRTETAGRDLPTPRLADQVGWIRRLFVDPQPVLDELVAAHGYVVGMGAGPVRVAVVGDPTVLRDMFSAPTSAFRWGHKFNVLGFVVGEGSMIVSDGDDHTRRRSSVKTAFSRRRLNGWIPMIVEQTDHAIDELVSATGPGGEVVDLYPIGRNLVRDIVVRSLFGDRLTARSAEIGELFRRPQAYLESPGYKQVPHRLPRTARARVRADRRALDEIIDAEIAELRRQPGDDPLDVLGALVADGTLTDGEIRDQVVTLIGAGFDTTSATLAWLLWEATLAPGLWGRLRAEADEVLGPLVPGRAPSLDDSTLSRLDLAGRAVQEATRLHPAGTISPREAAQDLVLGGYRIPSGTLILWSPYLAGRHPDVWAEPLAFDPERFVDPDAHQAELIRNAWVPFGRGARNCIGFALARMELTLIISRLAQRLDLAATAATTPRPHGMVVNRPTGGAPMTVAPR